MRANLKCPPEGGRYKTAATRFILLKANWGSRFPATNQPELVSAALQCYKKIMDKAATALSPTGFRRHLFYETSHSPSLAELVGYEKAKEIIDFCFIANPYYP